MNIYVDFTAGNDAAAGTSPETAWRSLEKVNATTFMPGDHIFLKCGSEWTGQLWPKGSGAEGKPITIDAYGAGVRPIIRANGLFEDAVLLKNQEHWEIQNLEITNTGAAIAVRRGVHVALDNFGEGHHIYLRSLVVHDVNGVNDNDDMKHNGGIIYTCDGTQKPSRFVDLRIEDNEIYHVDRSGIFGWSDRWQRSKWYPSLQVVVRGNHLEDIGGDGIVVVATDGALEEYNVVAHANQRSNGYNVAIWQWSTDNTTIQYNEAYGTKGQRDGEGFDADWNSRNTLIQYNYSHDNDGGFLLICNEGGDKPEDSAGNVGVIARYNISQNDRTRGINIAGPVKNTQIYNNTIYVGRDRDIDLILHADWHGWADDTVFYNNIFYVEGSARIAFALSRQPKGKWNTAPGLGQSTGNEFDSNVYFGNLSPVSEDAHASTADPKLAAAGQGGSGRLSLSGYRLRPGSPARGTAKPVAGAGSHDFWGPASTKCGGPDRGAIQSQDCGE